jgi:glycosyltransferase involved in cell wall biosynthesis
VSRPKVTVIVPAYNEVETLPVYWKVVEESLFSCQDVDFHILFIDDGSTDGTWPLIEAFCTASPRCRGIRLSRNFGSHIAASAGLDYADGDAVAIMACDLQDPPEVLLDFAAAWQKGAKVVWGHRRSREEHNLRTWLSSVFMALIRKYALPQGSKFTTGSFLLIDRQVVDCMKQFHESNRIIFALVAWSGFDQEIVYYDRRRRLHGKSRWSFGRQIKAVYDTLIGFSSVLPRLVTALGFAMSLVSFSSVVYLLISSYILSTSVRGWASIMVTMLLLFGATFMVLGLMSEYLSRIYAEAMQRPLYFVSDSTDRRR